MMDFGTWIAQPVNWVFLTLALVAAGAGLRVVTSQNVVHAALYLTAALGATAGLFLLLSAEFVAWVVVLVYIGAVVVLVLFGLMITRAPTQTDAGLDHPKVKPVAALVSLALFAVLAWVSVTAFEGVEISEVGVPTSTETIGEALLGRYVIPFEVVGFVLLAALIGGITLARRDPTLEEEETS